MDIDSDIARWILEFLLRQSLDDRLFNAFLRVLPLPNDNSRLKKTILLRRIESEISNALISEKILDFLEQIEELDFQEGNEASEAMKVAYCSVAVDCTVKFLEIGDEYNVKGEFFDVVKRIWRGRVSRMEKTVKGGLLSESLQIWKDEIEEAVWEKGAGEKVLKKSKANDAMEAVGVYLREAKESLGPSFLEVVAETLRGDDTVKKLLKLDFNLDGRAANSPSSGKDVDYAIQKGETQKENMLRRVKHVANRRSRGIASRTSRGVKIIDTDNMVVERSCKDYDLPPTPEVNKAQKTLESSCLELQALVKDPLPEAIHIAENVISNVDRINKEPKPVEESHNRVNTSGADGSVAAQGDNRIPDGRSCGQQPVPKQNLMERSSTVERYMWDDSIDDLAEELTDRGRRVQLPSPKRTVISPLRKYEPQKLVKRRKIKKWSTVEEDTLRTGVQKFGKGNWKLILQAYRDIFDERTEVDLKDKWRNMTRR